MEIGRSILGWALTCDSCPTSWSSEKQETVSSTSIDAKYVVASNTCTEAVWLRRFHNEMSHILGVSSVIHIKPAIDQASPLSLVSHLDFHGTIGHINMRHYFIRECMDGGNISPVWILGQKALSKGRFWERVSLGRGEPDTDTLGTIDHDVHD